MTEKIKITLELDKYDFIYFEAFLKAETMIRNLKQDVSGIDRSDQEIIRKVLKQIYLQKVPSC